MLAKKVAAQAWTDFNYLWIHQEGGDISKEIGGSVLMPVWRHVSLRWLFEMAGKVVVDEEDKIIEFLTLILFHFLRFGDIKIPIETENQYNVLILNETFRGVMIF